MIGIDPTPVMLGASGTLLVFGMAREGLFGVLPNALRDFAIAHPDGLVAVGPDGHPRFANARAHELLAPIEISSERPFGHVLDDGRLRAEMEAIAEGESQAARACLARPGGVLYRLDAGRPRWLQIQAIPVEGIFGRTKGYGVRIIDLTAHREAELHARQLRRLDSTADLARTVSRHFRGAFALVQSNAELLLEEQDHDPASERKLSRIIDAARYGADLALQLQLYTGSIGTARVVLELSKVVQEDCEMAESDLPPGVSIRFERSPELLPVHVDAVQLHHGVFEVLANAMSSMAGTGGEIRVSTGALHLEPAETALVWGETLPAGDYAYVRVSDSGGGMQPDVEERAFEPFFSTRKEADGAGLPTVLGIARAHSAPLALKNEPGRGCTVTLYFPLDRDTSGRSEDAGPAWG
jgi:signal transduction histidine kinase